MIVKIYLTVSHLAKDGKVKLRSLISNKKWMNLAKSIEEFRRQLEQERRAKK